MSDKSIAPPRPRNPYVGPRAIRKGEPLPARDRETRELADLLIAERIVLLHAPSGAGKTSLIQAGLAPLLAGGRFRPTEPLRVKTPPPEDGKLHNRYVYSVALDLLGSEREPGELARMDLGSVIAATRSWLDKEHFLVMVLDQFEEILLLDPTDRDSQRTFFRELGEALEDGTVWVLLSMREDYMGGLDRFLRYIPGHLAIRYRLDFLDSESGAAAAAIQDPARRKGIAFTDDAAAELVRQLTKAKVATPGGDEKEVSAPYVQPVQLQVVCRKLWTSVSHEKGAEFRGIELDDVNKHADIEGALRSYYADVVGRVAKEASAEELTIRRWLQRELISPQNYRSQTLSVPTSGGADPIEILRLLQEGYLIRGDERAGATWYELAHDKLVEPIIVDNEEWIRPYLEPWQLAAREWEATRDPARLLSGLDLRVAQRQSDRADMTHKERDFLDTSVRAEQDLGVVARTRTTLGSFWIVVLVIQLAVIVALLLVILHQRG